VSRVSRISKVMLRVRVRLGSGLGLVMAFIFQCFIKMVSKHQDFRCMFCYVLAELIVSSWQKKPSEIKSPHLLAVKRQLATGRSASDMSRTTMQWPRGRHSLAFQTSDPSD